MRRRNIEQEQNRVGVSNSVFVDLYNRTIPQGFPRATEEMLVKFEISHPLLFKKTGMWSIDKHRKRFMDWLSSHHSVR